MNNVVQAKFFLDILNVYKIRNSIIYHLIHEKILFERLTDK